MTKIISKSANKKGNRIINFIDRFKDNKKIRYVLVVLIAISVVLIFTSSFMQKNTENVETGVSDYVSELEEKLSTVLSKVKGVGKVSVIIKVDGGMETVLATKTTTIENGGKIESEQTPILVNGKTVVVQELYPKISGVIVVAEGAANISVMRKIQEATVSLLSISLDKIEILTMK